MTIQQILGLLGAVEDRFDQEGNLINLDSGVVVFVGDTHGDLEATRIVVDKYLNSENTLVFLGDYVDRGPASAENLALLLSLKLEYPDNLFLLMGNHEGRSAIQFYPADFWDSLEPEMSARYAAVLSKLPLVVSASNGIIALHGALPYVEKLDDICDISVGDTKWWHITWGDWMEQEGRRTGAYGFGGRPQFGQTWFDENMARLGKKVLIRSHQPDIRRTIYGGRCLTILTSSAYSAYVSERTIAIADLSKEINTVDDLTIEVV
jgi:predicted phosphodiesterase